MRVNLGRIWDHESSSTLELAWNVLRANGCTERSFCRLGLPGCPELLLTSPIVNPKVRCRSSLSAAFHQRILNKVPFSSTLTALSRVFSAGVQADYKGCRICTEHGVHSAAFDVPWVAQCPVHSCLLQPIGDYNISRVASRRSERLELIARLDRWAYAIITTLKKASHDVHPRIPMSRRRIGLRRWHFDSLTLLFDSCLERPQIPSLTMGGIDLVSFNVYSHRTCNVSEAYRKLEDHYRFQSQWVDDQVQWALHKLSKSTSGQHVHPGEFALQKGFESFLGRDRRPKNAWEVAELIKREWPNWRSPKILAFLSTEIDYHVTDSITVDQLSTDCIRSLVKIKLYQTLLNHLIKHQYRHSTNCLGEATHQAFASECEASAFSVLYVSNPRRMLIVPDLSFREVINLALNPDEFWSVDEWEWPW